jgi:hypothetical protein
MAKSFTSGHLGLEHLDQVVEAARASHLGQHVVELGLGHELADVVEGGAEVVLGDGAILWREGQPSARDQRQCDQIGKFWA